MRTGITYFNKAEKYYDNDNYNLALKYINKAIVLNNTDYSYYRLKAEILRMQNKYKESLKQYNKALGLNNKDDISFFCKGYVYYKMNKPVCRQFSGSSVWRNTHCTTRAADFRVNL